MKRNLFLSLGVVSLLISTMAQAQLPTELSSTARDSYNFNRDSTTTLFAGKGTFIRLGRPANAVFVANPDIADVEIKFPQMIYVYAKAPGDTSVHVLDEEGKTILNETIKVFLNVDQARASLAELLPTSSLEVRGVNDSLVVSGTVNNTRDAELALRLVRRFTGSDDNVINMINVVESNQITLQVRFAELSRELSKQIGINWNFDATNGNFTNGVGFNGGALGIIGGGGINNAFNAGGTNIDTLLRALVEENMATILAQPNLTTLSGEEASFLAGGSFPTVAVSANGTDVVYRPFGVSLSFLPQVVGENRIRLRVRPEVSTRTGEFIAGFPVLRQREAETTVELGDGQSFTIAGILQNELIEELRSVPGLSDVPILGALFKSTTFRRNESELVIIITPYIVQPVSESNLATPLDDIFVPSMSDRLLYGQSLSTTIRPSKVFLGKNAPSLSGPVGFMLD